MLVASLFALVAPAYAAQLAVQVEASEVHEGQTVGLSLVVSDASPRGAPTLTVPDGLQVQFRSQSQSSMLINFRMTNTVTFHYALTALREGTYTLPAAHVMTTAGTLLSSPVTLKVGPRAANGVNDLVATLGTDVAWVGQVLLYTASFTSDQSRLQGQWHPPDVPGLAVEPGVEPLTPRDESLQDGKPLASLRLIYPLRATKAGRYTVPGAVLEAQVPVQRQRSRDRLGGIFDELNAFGDFATQVYSAKPLPLEVRAIPDEGRPATYTGLVGRFALTVKPSATTVNVGDTVTLSVEVEGDGTLAGVTLPPLTGDGFRVYDDQPTVEARIDGDRLSAHAAFKRALVPQVPGDITLPAMELAYFDPSAAAFRTARAEPITLRVGGTAGSAQVASFATGDARASVDALAEDILPVRTEARLASPWSGRWAWLPIIPGGLLLLGQAASRWRPRRTVVERPFGFDDLPAEPEARLGGLERIFRERVGARVGIAPGALHREDLALLGPLEGEAEAIYRELERLRYGGAAGGLPEAALRALVEKL